MVDTYRGRGAPAAFRRSLATGGFFARIPFDGGFWFRAPALPLAGVLHDAPDECIRKRGRASRAGAEGSSSWEDAT
jgi:hypothetical protein